jgi:hypothetical protein
VLFIPVGIAVVLKQLHEIGDALFEHRYHRLIAPQIDRMTAKLRKASPRASPKSPSGGGGGEEEEEEEGFEEAWGQRQHADNKVLTIRLAEFQLQMLVALQQPPEPRLMHTLAAEFAMLDTHNNGVLTAADLDPCAKRGVVALETKMEMGHPMCAQHVAHTLGMSAKHSLGRRDKKAAADGVVEMAAEAAQPEPEPEAAEATAAAAAAEAAAAEEAAVAAASSDAYAAASLSSLATMATTPAARAASPALASFFPAGAGAGADGVEGRAGGEDRRTVVEQIGEKLNRAEKIMV